MENKPSKHRGFRQGLHEQSSTAKETLGLIRNDGQRVFRYAKNGPTYALSAGKLNLTPTLNAAHVSEAILVDVPVGTLNMAVTVTTGVAIAANALKGGYLQINAGTGLGRQYMISSNSAIDTSGAIVYLDLEEPGIMVALDDTSKFNLAPSPQYAVYENANEEAPGAGVPLIPISIGYYFWNQVKGVAMVLQSDTAVPGITVINGATSGAVVSTSNKWVIDIPVVGVKVSLQAVSGDYSPVYLLLT
jgi:hypothetical protein